MLVTMKCEVTFDGAGHGKVLYHTDNFVFRNEYQLAATHACHFGTIVQPLQTRASGIVFPGKRSRGWTAWRRILQQRLVAAVTENY